MDGKSVLIIEDNLDVQSLYAQALKREGFRVTACCTTGEEAMAQLKEPQSADLVILDLSLPDVPGVELVKRFRSNPNWARSKIVVVSGWELSKAGPLPVDGYLRKPFELKAFYQEVRRCTH